MRHIRAHCVCVSATMGMCEQGLWQQVQQNMPDQQLGVSHVCEASLQRLQPDCTWAPGAPGATLPAAPCKAMGHVPQKRAWTAIIIIVLVLW